MEEMGKAKLPMKFSEKKKMRSTTYGLRRKHRNSPFSATRSALSSTPTRLSPRPRWNQRSALRALRRFIRYSTGTNACHRRTSRSESRTSVAFLSQRGGSLSRICSSSRGRPWRPSTRLGIPFWILLTGTVYKGWFRSWMRSVLVKKMIVFFKKAENHGFYSPDPTLTTFQFNDHSAIDGFGYAQQPASLCGYQWEYQNPSCEYRAVDTSCYQVLPFGLGSDNKLLALGFDHQSGSGLQNQEERLGNPGVAGVNGSVMPENKDS
ncbi:hypothetical protein AKJ16_DCAP23570 [Drosera capensis]